MAKMSEEEKRIKKIYKSTKSSMEALGTFREEFDPTIQRYSELRFQFDVLNTKFIENGYKITEEYTNKSGATNIRKSAEWMALENLRRELLEMETQFGLTPKGLKNITPKGLDKPKETALDKALKALDG